MPTGLRVQICLCLLLGAVAAGCGSREPPLGKEELHIQKAGRMYIQYVSKHAGQGPKSTEQLKAFIKSLPDSSLKSLGVERSNIDAVFTSPRDNQPYVVRKLSKKQIGIPGKESKSPVILYEKEGSGGKRYVVYGPLTLSIEQVDQEKFKELVPEAH